MFQATGPHAAEAPQCCQALACIPQRPPGGVPHPSQKPKSPLDPPRIAPCSMAGPAFS